MRSGTPGALRGLIRKETYHILRDRRTLAVVLALPVAQVLLFGYALQTDVDRVRLVVVDPAPDVATREVVDRFAATSEYRIVERVATAKALSDRFARGKADQAIVFEPGFARRLRGGAAPASILVVTDAASPLTGGLTEAYARGVLARYLAEPRSGPPATAPAAASEAASVGDSTAAPAVASIEARTRFWFNPTLESQVLFVPGLLAFVLTIISAMMTAVTVAREKETGTLEVLLVSPLRPVQIILGKVTPYLGLAFVDAILTLGVAWAVFHVPFRGSLPLLFAESLLFVAVSLGLGVLISIRTPSQRTAMLGIILGTMLPTAILSGMIFPIESMPGWLQPVTHLVPAKWFITVVRGILLKGAGLDVLWDETLVLVGMTAVLLVASVRSFRPRLA